MTRPTFDPSSHWRSRAAVDRARAAVLDHARRTLSARRAASTAVFADAHSGAAHLEHFEMLLGDVAKQLPQGARALEVGAGLGWIAALLAARRQDLRILATEIGWAAHPARDFGNAFTLYRMAEPRLRDVLQFRFEGAELTGFAFPPSMAFATAAAEALPVRDASLHLHYSLNCLEHVADVGATMAEAARVLAIGGFAAAATEPLFFSAQGHHLWDIAPIPWGHLLWDEAEFADIAVRECGAREWSPGVPLRADHLREGVFAHLNRTTHSAIRRALVRGPWSIAGWQDLHNPADAALLRELGVAEALKGIRAEDLLARGVRFVLRRELRPRGLRIPLRVGFAARSRMRRLLGTANSR